MSTPSYSGEAVTQVPTGALSQSVMAGIPPSDTAAVLTAAPPGESAYTPPAPDLADVLPILKQAYADLMQARDGYARADQYFRGISPEVFNDPALRRLLGLSEEAYALNYASIPVKVIANRLNIMSMTVPND